MTHRAFKQVDVFTAVPYRGNALAVVLDAEGLDEADMLRFAQWTNLAETTFVLPPTLPGADYRVRIFTTTTELPFAGHPTLGTAHAWLEAGGAAARPGVVVQECAAGPIEVRVHPAEDDGGARRLAFRAPPTTRSGPLEEDVLEWALAGLGLGRDDVLEHQWVANGPQWAALLLRDADAVLALEPDFATLEGLEIGVIGAHGSPGVPAGRYADGAARRPKGARAELEPLPPAAVPHGRAAGAGAPATGNSGTAAGPSGPAPDPGGTAAGSSGPSAFQSAVAGAPADYEVRAFCPGEGLPEDPVTGSLNAGIAQWLIPAGLAPGSYTVRQGTRLGRTGLVGLDSDAEGIWVSGNVVTCIDGTVR
jgi:predicted PhzF superfamily epimerase YddE/YHI9